MKRTQTNRPARLTFTYDHHELLRGDLRPGSEVSIRYDPKRIVPDGEPYVFGDPGTPITAHVAFHAGEAPVTQPVISEAGVVAEPIVDATGEGSMLTCTFKVPDDAAEMIVWFEYAGHGGAVHYDSDNGSNFRFSFVSRELRIVAADVVPGSLANQSVFTLEVACNTLVERVLVRARGVNHPEINQEIELTRTGAVSSDPQGWPHWTLPMTAVPLGTIIQFKLHYWMWNVRYKDDNGGLYYLVPAPRENVPPPPPELAAAAQRWGQPPSSGRA